MKIHICAALLALTGCSTAQPIWDYLESTDGLQYHELNEEQRAAYDAKLRQRGKAQHERSQKLLQEREEKFQAHLAELKRRFPESYQNLLPDHGPLIPKDYQTERAILELRRALREEYRRY